MMTRIVAFWEKVSNCFFWSALNFFYWFDLDPPLVKMMLDEEELRRPPKPLSAEVSHFLSSNIL